MGNMQRAKGKRGELEAIHQLEALTGLTLSREYGQAAAGGHDCTIAIAGGVICLEIKRQEEECHSAWWAQAIAAAGQVPGGIPVVVWRRSRQPWRARVPLRWLTGGSWPLEQGLGVTAIISLEAFGHLVVAQALAIRETSMYV